MPKFSRRKLSDFFRKEFRDYSLYTIHHRAIPTLMDGLKPVQKKILYTARLHAKSKPVKVASLAGHVLADADYKHGDSSCSAAIVNMAAAWRNNIPLLRGDGNFGWRLYPEAAAARYIFVQLSNDFLKWFGDDNVLDPVIGDDGKTYEPKVYYPYIPWFLVNGIEGIATGYSCFCHPRSPQRLRDMTLAVLDGKAPDPTALDIVYPAYNGEIKDGYSIGKCRYRKGKLLEILSLPVDQTMDSYTPRLVQLVEEGKIRDFHKTVSATDPPFLVEMREKIEDPTEMLGLRRKLKGETVTLLHGNRLFTFDSAWDAVGVFIDERLNIAEKSIAQTKVEKNDMISRIETKVMFVENLQYRGLSNLSKSELGKIAATMPRTDMVDTLLSMTASSMTSESLAKWTDEMSRLKADIDILGRVTPVQWFKYSLLRTI